MKNILKSISENEHHFKEEIQNVLAKIHKIF